MKLKDRIQNELENLELCNDRYCPWHKEGHSPTSVCEGCCCDKAKENRMNELKEMIV